MRGTCFSRLGLLVKSMSRRLPRRTPQRLEMPLPLKNSCDGSQVASLEMSLWVRGNVHSTNSGPECGVSLALAERNRLSTNRQRMLGNLEELFGGEGGIRTQQDSLDSASCGF